MLRLFSVPLAALLLGCHLPLLNPSFPGGTIIEIETARIHNIYYFCKDRTARVDIEFSKHLSHKRFGTFETADDGIQILWRRELGTRGVGRPFTCNDGVCHYPKYRPFQNSIWETETLDLAAYRREGDVSIAGFSGVCDPFR